MKRSLILLFVVFALLAGCAKKEPERSVLSKGTSVRLMLLKELHAGRESVGSPVQFLLMEDVRDAKGRLLMKKGSPVSAKVSRSRGEGTLSGAMNQPARLNITFDQTKAVDGTQVLLSADKGGARDAEYEFTRANTGIPGKSRSMESALDDEERRQLLVRLAEMISENRDGNLSNDPRSEELVRGLADQLGLSDTRALDAKGDLDKATGLLGQVSSGRIDLDLLMSASLGTVNSLIELTQVAAFAVNRVGGMLKGRTIRAHFGTEVTAYVAADATVTIQPEEPE